MCPFSAFIARKRGTDRGMPWRRGVEQRQCNAVYGRVRGNSLHMLAVRVRGNNVSAGARQQLYTRTRWRCRHALLARCGADAQLSETQRCVACFVALSSVSMAARTPPSLPTRASAFAVRRTCARICTAIAMRN